MFFASPGGLTKRICPFWKELNHLTILLHFDREVKELFVDFEFFYDFLAEKLR